MNTTNQSKNALNEADIDQLSEYLDRIYEHRACVSLESLDGIIAALAIMIRPVGLSELIPIILDTNESFGNNESYTDNQTKNITIGDKNSITYLTPLTHTEQLHLAHLINRRINHTARLLSNTTINDLSDPRAYQPWIINYQEDCQEQGKNLNIIPSKESVAKSVAPKEIDSLPLAFEWAIGFISAVEHFSQDWRMADELLDEELNPMLAPIYALALPKEEWPIDIREQDVAGNSREAWLAQAIWACYELWEYWRYHAPKPKLPPIINSIHLGRNDPCHCGSGKKFKNCHGQ